MMVLDGHFAEVMIEITKIKVYSVIFCTLEHGLAIPNKSIFKLLAFFFHKILPIKPLL